MRMPAAPQVAIPQLKSQSLTRPAKPTAKKAKVAAGGTALLGLVTLLCLTGTFPSWPGSSNLPARLDSHVSGRPLPSTCSCTLLKSECFSHNLRPQQREHHQCNGTLSVPQESAAPHKLLRACHQCIICRHESSNKLCGRACCCMTVEHQRGTYAGVGNGA